jgi:sugar lactone lactonase YvrE
MYIADRPNWQLLAFDFDADTAEVTNRRRFASVSEGQIPDGAAVDVEGGYWIAIFGAGRILRFLPDGTLDRELLAPVSHPTMVAFGGAELSDLYVTSSRHFASAVVSEEPQAGGVFRTSVKVAGLREPRFRLPESWMGI